MRTFSFPKVGVSLTTALIILSLGWPPQAITDDHATVRIYRLNSKDQPIRMRRLGKADETGCHNFRRPRKAQRLAQTGYAWCTVYTDNHCAEGTEVGAMWGGKKYRVADIDITKPQTRLLRGSQWILAEQNIKISAFRCVYE